MRFKFAFSEYYKRPHDVGSDGPINTEDALQHAHAASQSDVDDDGQDIRMLNGEVQYDTDDQRPKPIVIYGEPIFTLPKNQSVSEKFGRRSICALEVTVPILSCGLIVTAAIWSRIVEKSDGTTIESDLSLPRNVNFNDAADKDLFKDHIGAAMSVWPSYQRTMERADDLLVNGKPKAATKAASMFASRLVKRPAAATAPNAA